MSITINREQVFEKVKQLPPNIVVIEGVWDGDSSGWCVDLVAIEEPLLSHYFRTHLLTSIGHGLGEIHDFNRMLTGQIPPYPEGKLAYELGQAIADQLNVPLYFPSPEKPVGDEVPRWVDWQAGRVSSIPIGLIDSQVVIDRFSTAEIAVVEAYWGYLHTWHPRLAVITLEDRASHPLKYKSHKIGKLYWDKEDMGRIIRGQSIPSRTPTEEAIRIGELLAEKLHTTFYFMSPDNPQWRIPRWIDTQGGEWIRS
ncbi:MAG: hypothetical protein K8L91_03920 [Anaerolineae bacterium]|nr:hypothetical protein [Anaerolineae bacterium]